MAKKNVISGVADSLRKGIKETEKAVSKAYNNAKKATANASGAKKKSTGNGKSNITSVADNVRRGTETIKNSVSNVAKKSTANASAEKKSDLNKTSRSGGISRIADNVNRGVDRITREAARAIGGYDIKNVSETIAEKIQSRVPLRSADGTYFGDVPYLTMRRLENFKLGDNYKFDSEETRLAVEKYRKHPGINLPIGDKEYQLTYDGYKALKSGEWEKYKPVKGEEDAFKAWRNYPIYDLKVKDSQGEERNFGKISYNGFKKLEKGEDYSSAFPDEKKTVAIYNEYLAQNKPKSYKEVYDKAYINMVNLGKVKAETQHINTEMYHDDEFYVGLLSAQEKESIWKKFDKELASSVQTDGDRNLYLQMIDKRGKDLSASWSDTYNTAETNNKISALRKELEKTKSDFDKGYQAKVYVDNIKKIEEGGKKTNEKYLKKVNDAGKSGDYKQKTNIAERPIYDEDNLSSEEKYDVINMLHSGKLKKENLSRNNLSLFETNELPWMHMEDAEVKIYNASYEISPETAEKYLKELEPLLRLRMSNSTKKDAEKYGEAHPYVGGLLSIGKNLTNAGPAFMDNVVGGILGDNTEYSDASIALRQSQALRSGGTKFMQEKHGKVAAWAYNTGMSILENVAVMSITGAAGSAAGLGTKATSTITTNLMAMNAASNQMISVADRGGTWEQMILGGSAAYMSEYLFEKMPVEKIMSIRGGNAVRNAVGGMLAEIPGEMGTEVSNIIADTVIMGDKSESRLRARYLVTEKGMTADEATRQVFLENLDQVLQAGASGGVSGGVMGGGATIVNNIAYNSRMNPLAKNVMNSTDALDAVISLGTELNIPEAKIVGDITKSGRTPGTQQVRKMVDTVVKESIRKDASLPNVVKTIGAIEGRDAEYIGSQESIDTARAIYKLVAGVATEADNALIERSEGARTIMLASANTIDGSDSSDTAWGSLKAEAERRSSENSSAAKAVPLPLGGEGSEVRSEASTKSDVKYKIAKNSKGEYVKASRRVIKGDNPKEWAGQVEEYINDSIRKNKDVMFAGADGNLFVITTDTAGKARFRNVVDENGKKRRMTDSEYATKLRAETHIDELIQTSKTGKSRDDSKSHSFAKDGFNYRKAYFEDFDGTYYEVTISVGKNGIVNTVYNVGRLDKRTNPSYNGSKTNQKYSDHEGFVDKTRVPQKEDSVNSKDMQNVEKDASDNVHKSEKDARYEKVPSPEEAKKAKNVDNGIVVTEESKQLKKENLKAHNNIGKLATSLNTRAVVVSGLRNSKGEVLAGQLRDGVIYVNADVDADKLSRWAALHEASHLIKQKQKKAKMWQRFENYAIKRLKETGKYKDKYEAKKEHYEPEEIHEELACDFIGEMFDSEAELTEFIRTDKSFAVKVRDFFYNALSRMGLFGERKKAQALWLKAYVAAMKNKKDVATTAKYGMQSANSHKVYDAETDQFTVDEKVVKSFGEKVDAWLQGEVKGDEFFELGDTPIVLYELGAENLPVEFGNNVMWKMTGGRHGIAIEDIKELPKVINNPLMVLKSSTVDNSFVVITELFDKVGDPVIAAIHLNKWKKHLRINRVASVYGKENMDNFLKKEIKDGNLKYIDKIKSQEWSQSRGLQLPKLADTNPDNNIILQKEDVVNKYSMQNDENYDKESVAGTRVVDNPSVSAEKLLEENARLREELENIHIQLDQAEGKGLDTKAIKKAAEDIRKAYGSKIKVSDLHKELVKLYTYMSKSYVDGNEVARRINNIAEEVIANATEIVNTGEYDELLDRIKKTRITVPEADKESFSEGYEHFRKHNMGKIILSNYGYHLDAFWDDLVNEYPNLFSEDTRGSEERLNRLLEIREEFKSAYALLADQNALHFSTRLHTNIAKNDY